jgi:DNA polymerase I-like protein with 3'-5' exonuclease and polymerase domains
MSLHGMHFDPVKRGYIVRKCEDRYKQLNRVLRILVGFDLNPGSPDQVVNYLHTQLRYKPEKTTDKGSPSVAGDALYKIKLKHPKNVAIDVIFEMRRMVKLKGMLGFQQWIWEY